MAQGVVKSHLSDSTHYQLVWFLKYAYGWKLQIFPAFSSVQSLRSQVQNSLLSTLPIKRFYVFKTKFRKSFVFCWLFARGITMNQAEKMCHREREESNRMASHLYGAIQKGQIYSLTQPPIWRAMLKSTEGCSALPGNRIFHSIYIP